MKNIRREALDARKIYCSFQCMYRIKLGLGVEHCLHRASSVPQAECVAISINIVKRSATSTSIYLGDKFSLQGSGSIYSKAINDSHHNTHTFNFAGLTCDNHYILLNSIPNVSE
jgi:hypothetical protein